MKPLTPAAVFGEILRGNAQMKRFAVLLVALFALLPALPAHAEGISSGQCVGCTEGINNPTVAAAVVPSCTYTGPGDVQAYIVFWGLRAYSAATCGNRIANVCNSTGGVDVACADILSSATTGALVPQTIGGITCPGANCTVKIMYDLTLGTDCGGAPCDTTVLSGVIADRPLLIASCIGSLPCMQFRNSATSYMTSASTNTAHAQPYSLVVAATQTGNPGSGSDIYLGESSSNSRITNETGGSVAFGCATLGTGNAATNGTFYSFVGTCNGGSEVIYQNAVVGASGSGTANITASVFYWGYNGPIEILELGVTTGVAAFSTVTSNQRTYWGF